MKELWLKNHTGMDVGLGDLGFKVPAFDTVNVYKRSPYLNDVILKKSFEDGSLYKRITAGKLEVVKGKKNPKPITLDQIKATTGAAQIVAQITKSKTSVVINTDDLDVLEDGDLGEIASYGFDEIKNIDFVKDDTGSAVVALQHEGDGTDDSKELLEAGVDVDAMRNAGVQDSVIKVIVKQVNESKADKVFVVEPPDDVKEEPQETETQPKVGKDESGSVVLEGKTAGTRSLKGLSELNKVAAELGVKVEDLPEDVVDQVDADQAVAFEETEFDVKVATKDKTGAVVMKLKQTESEDSQPVVVMDEKKQPKKVTKKKTSKRKASKTTKK